MSRQWLLLEPDGVLSCPVMLVLVIRFEFQENDICCTFYLFLINFAGSYSFDECSACIS